MLLLFIFNALKKATSYLLENNHLPQSAVSAKYSNRRGAQSREAGRKEAAGGFAVSLVLM